MKTSTVIGIVIFIVALIVVWSVQNIVKERRRALPGEDFVKILPEDMRAADIRKVEIYKGDAKEDAIVLERSEEGWSVPSRFGSKGDEKNIKDLLDEIKKLEGTLRTKKKSLHPDFEITDEKAVHIALYKEGDKLYQDLLLGKKGERYGEGFVRLADSKEVYLAGKNLRSTLGMYGEDDDPDPKKWLDLKITDEDNEKVAKVVLDMPGKEVVLEKKEKEKEEEKESGEEEEPDGTEDKEEEKKEYEWVLTKPEIEFELKEAAVKSLVRSVSEFKGEDVADPAKLDEYGFDSPTYTATVTLDDDSTKTIFVGKKTEEDNKRYAKLKDGNTVYIVPQYTVTGVFKKMRDLVDIKIWDLEQDDVASVHLHKPEYEIVLKRQLKEGASGEDAKDYTWVLEKPETRFELKEYRINSILSRVTKPSPQDLFLTGELESYALADPEHKAVVKMKDDSIHVLSFGKQVEDGEDRYVKFEGKDHVYSFTKYNFDDLFPTLPKLLTIEIMEDLAKDDIVALKYDTDEEDFELAQEEGEGAAARKKWIVKAGEEESEAKRSVVDDILDAITDIRPEEMVVGKADADCGFDTPEATLTVSTKKTADQYVLLFGKQVSEESGNRYFKIKGDSEVFVLTKDNCVDILKKTEDLKVKEPPKPKEKKEIPAEGETVPSIEEPPPSSTEEKPATEERKPEEEETQPELEKEKTEPAVPEKDIPPPDLERKEGEEDKPPPPEKEEPTPPPSGEQPSPQIPKKDIPKPPLPKPPGPPEPLPLPPTPNTD